MDTSSFDCTNSLLEFCRAVVLVCFERLVTDNGDTCIDELIVCGTALLIALLIALQLSFIAVSCRGHDVLSDRLIGKFLSKNVVIMLW